MFNKGSNGIFRVFFFFFEKKRILWQSFNQAFPDYIDEQGPLNGFCERGFCLKTRTYTISTDYLKKKKPMINYSIITRSRY